MTRLALSILFLLSVGVFVTSPQLLADGEDEGFVSLMTVKSGDSWTENGKPLNGWIKHGGEATYEVLGDEIVGRRGPGPNTFLCTEKSYSNFILKFEFRYDVDCNSGMQFRSNLNENGVVSGYQCEIDSGGMTGLTGWVYDESRRNRWLKTPDEEDRRRIAEATREGDWNAMTVQCVGPSLITWLNDVKIDDLVDLETQEGFLGLQVHGGPQGQLRWRNIRIQELPPTSWIPLFADGQFGEATAEPAEKWTILDNGLLQTSTGATQTQDSLLASKREYADFAIKMSYRDIAAPCGLFFRARPNNQQIGYQGVQYDIAAGASTGGLWDSGGRGWIAQNDELSNEMYRSDDWNRIGVAALGSRLTTFLNGREIVELLDAKGAKQGYAALQISRNAEKTGCIIDDFRIMPLDDEAMKLISDASFVETKLNIGAARADITPSKSVPLCGMFELRFPQSVETPLVANVVVLESTENGKSRDQAVFVSIDLALVPNALHVAIQNEVARRDPFINPEKIVVSATHAHTAPTVDPVYPRLPPSETVMDVPEAIDFIAERTAAAVVAAWKNRQPGKMAYGLDFAGVGFNRRATYSDGRSVMYGNSNQPDFRGYEAMEDHDIGTLFFLDENDKMLAVAVNIACPSQEVESRLKINADFWHPVRETLKKRFGDDLVVLGWCSAAGDASPHVQYRRAAFDRMRTLRGLDEMNEITRKIDRAVADTWEVVRTTASFDVPLAHRVETLQLPLRKVTETEYAESKAACDRVDAKLKANPDKPHAEIDWVEGWWYGDTVKRYEMQQADPNATLASAVHVIRLGDVMICTNQFELYTDYGIQMKARSPAIQTFVIQLVGGGTYLPTERAVRGGSYSAIIQSTPVGPEGGQVLVEETLKIADKLFQK